MSRLTDRDRRFGPFTVGPCHKAISIEWSSGGGYSEQRNSIQIRAFGKVLRMWVPNILKPYGERYDTHPVTYGVSLSDMGNGYDFLQVFLGPQTHDSLTTKSWCRFIPWKQWNFVRHSIYTPDGSHFATEEKGKWKEFYKLKDECPKSHFGFEDFDGDMRIASCIIEEREWHKGDGWFSWLRYLSKPKVSRSIWFEFDAEVGPEKGSWKGGTIATGMDMLPNGDPESTFRRWCEREHRSKHKSYKVRFIGKSNPPAPRVRESSSTEVCSAASKPSAS